MEKIEINKLKRMFKNGFDLIAENYETINDLNVFPVPDGDTGTNLKITTSNAWKEISNLNINNISAFGKYLSRALLMNARGNSGVIFSQIIKGFVSSFDNNIDLIDVKMLIKCFNDAKNTAYSAVSKPIEGTILTIIKDVAEKLNENQDKFTSVEELFKFVVETSKTSLNNTPNLLPALKKADVVDSGGYGLWCFLLGMYKSFDIEVNEYIINETKTLNIENNQATKELSKKFDISKYDDQESGFGYCSELIIKINSKISPESEEKKVFNFEKFKEQLLKLGESLVCIQDNDIVKVHLHTLHPGTFLTYAQKFGEFVKIKIENMTEQFYERLQNKGVNVIENINYKLNLTNLSSKPAIVITSPSKQITEILKNDYEFNHILDCSNGNPSIEELFIAIQQANSKNVILIIDDSNILLAANQAKGLLEGKINVKIIVTSNVLESLVCSLEFDENTNLNINEKNINKVLKNINSAMVSISTKDVEYSNVKVKKDDYVGIIKKRIVAANKDQYEIVKSMVDALIKQIKQPDILMIIYDNDDDQTKDVLSKIQDYVTSKYQLICDFKEGKQKVYNYYICLQ